MSRRTLILLLWLVVGAAAAGQRGYYSGAISGCSGGATIGVTILAGPLNYLGLNPQVACTLPKPSS
jgi:hypothetical protein